MKLSNISNSTKKVLSILLILIIASSFTIYINNFPGNKIMTPLPHNKKIILMGDSYTIGQSVNVKDRWPVQLENKLTTEGILISELKIIAQTGWTTSDLIRGIENEITNPPYDLVTLQIGVNNQFRNEGIDKFRDELILLMKQAIEFAGGNSSKVIIISIPDWGATPFAENFDRDLIASEIDLFNSITLEQSNVFNLTFIDITPISRQAIDNPLLIAEDGLHPSMEMYKQWVDLMLPIVLAILK